MLPSHVAPPHHRRTRRLSAAIALAAAIMMAGATVGCTGSRRDRADASQQLAAAADRANAGAPPAAGQTGKPPTGGHAPTTVFAVGTRTVTVARAPVRKLRTTIWYPGTKSGAVAPGRFPVILLSHGLHGTSTDYRALATRWASAGFVVVAPNYPHTSRGVKNFDVADVLNQPADASFALTTVLALDNKAGDALRGHVNSQRLAAAGHSAGAITTVGLFANGRDARLDAGVVLAGNALGMGDAYIGDPAALLFVHGDKDPFTPYSLGWDAYTAVPAIWPRAFLTLPGQGHFDPYFRTDKPAFAAVAATTTDFLRWTLYGDAAAKARLAKDAGRGNRLDAKLL